MSEQSSARFSLEGVTISGKPKSFDFNTQSAEGRRRTSYHVELMEGEDGWFVVKCKEIPAAISQGKTKDEALRNILEAITLILEEQTEQIPDNPTEINIIPVEKKPFFV